MQLRKKTCYSSLEIDFRLSIGALLLHDSVALALCQCSVLHSQASGKFQGECLCSRLFQMTRLVQRERNLRPIGVTYAPASSSCCIPTSQCLALPLPSLENKVRANLFSCRRKSASGLSLVVLCVQPRQQQQSYSKQILGARFVPTQLHHSETACMVSTSVRVQKTTF